MRREKTFNPVKKQRNSSRNWGYTFNEVTGDVTIRFTHRTSDKERYVFSQVIQGSSIFNTRGNVRDLIAAAWRNMRRGIGPYVAQDLEKRSA